MIDRQAAIEALLERYENPSHRGGSDDPRARRGRAENPRCGDVVEATVVLEGQRIAAAWFEGHGCTISQALADAACEAVEGRSVDEARQVSLDAVLEVVGAGLAASRPDCAAVGLRALRQALGQDSSA